MTDQQRPTEQPGPDEAFKMKNAPDNADTEGHSSSHKFGPRPATEQPAPDESFKMKASDDSDTEGHRVPATPRAAEEPAPDGSFKMHQRGDDADDDVEGHHYRGF